jgi:hypothetical protein
MEKSVSPFESTCDATNCEICPIAQIMIGKIGDIISRQGINPKEASFNLRKSDIVSSFSEDCMPYLASVISKYTNIQEEANIGGKITVPEKFQSIIDGEELPPLPEYSGEERRSHPRGIAEETLTSLRNLSSRNGGDLKKSLLEGVNEETMDEVQDKLTHQKQKLVYKDSEGKPPRDTMIKTDPAPRRRKLDL